MLVGADGDDLVAGGGGEAAGGVGGAEVHCTSTPPTMAIAATVRSLLVAPTGTESILRDLIRKTAVMGGSAGHVQVRSTVPETYELPAYDQLCR